jgi:CubicO group peptidase (beta-lactamase class C family)
MSALYAAGGYHSTVSDLQRFHDGLFGGKLIREETLRRSLEPMTLNDGSESPQSRGGWQIDTVGGNRAWMKGGALPGVCTWYATIPDEGAAVFLLSNRSAGEPRCGRLAVRLLEAVLAN